ncbi:phage tail length tape measure family protein, partial [Terasakiella pusilla]|uniref:phage tail length tape measure family protein n=1 Tax=Terasakiella pusilla TaxID=64973 RepID=UPI003AA8EDF5
MATRNFGTLTIDLVAKMGGFESGLSQAERRAEDFNRKASRSFEKLSPATRRVNEATRALQDLDRAFESGKFNLKIDGMDELQSYELMRRQLEDVRQSAIQAQAALGEVGSLADFQKLARQIDPTIGRLEELTSQQNRLNAAFKAGNVNEEEYRRLNTQLEESRRQIDGTTASMGRMNNTAGQTRMAMQQLPMQFSDIWVSLAAGQNPMMVFIQQGSQIKDSFGGALPALRAMGGYVAGLVNPFTLAAGAAVGLTVAYEQGRREQQAFANTLIMTGNQAGTTADSMSDLAGEMDAMAGVTQRQAAKVLNEVAESGKFTSEQFDLVSRAALRMQEATGKSVQDTVEEFEEIAGGPVDAVAELNDKYNFLTADIYDNILALERSGDTAGAAQLAMESYADAIQERTDKIADNFGTLEKVINAVKNSAAEMWDSILDVGREETLTQRIARLRGELEDVNEMSTSYGAVGAGNVTSSREREALQAQLATLEALNLATEAGAMAKSRQNEEMQQHIQMRQREQKLLEDAVPRIAKINEEIAFLRERMADAGGNTEQYEQAISMLEEERKRINESGSAHRGRSQALKDAAQIEREYQKALESSGNVYAKLFAEMSPAGEAQADYNATIAELQVALNAGTKSTLEYYAAVAQAAKVYNEAVAASDPYAKELKRIVDQYDSAYQRGMQLQRSLQMINQAWRDDPQNGAQYARVVAGIREEIEQLALEADPLAQEMARLWEEAGERIDETFADAFRGAFDSFSSFSDQLADGFKRLLAELAYQATLKPIVVGFTQDMHGLLGIGGGSSSGGFGGIGSLISGGKSLLGLGSTAATGTALSGGFMGAAATQSAGSLYGMAATGGVAQAGLASSIAAGISTAMPWIAGGLAIDSLLGGGITKAISGLFGGKSRGPSFDLMTTNQDPRTIFEDVQHGVTASGAFGNVGFHGGNTNRLEETFGSFDNARQFLETIAATDDMIAALAPGDVEAMTYAIQQMRLKSSDAAGIADQLGNRTKAAFGAMSGDFGAFARTLTGSTEEIIAQAQATQQAHALLTSASERLGLQFNIAGGYAYEAAQDIAQLAGGVENLSALQQSYYQNFFTEAERAAHLTDDIAQALNEMGMQMPETRAGFRELVEAQDQATQAGRENYVQLLELESAFAQLTPAIEDTGSAADTASEALRMQGQLNRQLLQAQGDTDALRQLEIDALKETQGWQEAGLVTTQKRIWAIEDEKEAQREAERAQQERIRAIEQEANAWQRAQQQLASFGVSIDSWIDNLRGTDAGLGTPGDQLAAASAAFDEQYAKALSGDQAALGSITQYADRFIEAQKGWSASGEQTVSTIDRVTGMLEKLPDQLTPEQFLAEEFKGIIDGQTVTLESAQFDSIGGLSSAITASLASGFAGIDLDASGLIDWAEFYKAFQGLASEDGLRTIFNAIDANGDGTISKLEAVNASTKDLADPNTEGMKVSIGRHHNPSGLIDMAYNWGTKWAEMGASGFSGAGGGELDYSKPSTGGSSSGGGSGSSSGGSGSSSGDGSATPSAAQQWIDQFFANEPSAQQFLSIGNILDNWKSYDGAVRKTGQSLVELAALGANMPGDDVRLSDIDSSWKFFAKGGVFTNGIVSSPTMFDMGVMGEAGPEAIVPLHMGSDGLGIRDYSAPLPALSSFPLLNQSDQAQINRDLLNEVKKLREELNRAL